MKKCDKPNQQGQVAKHCIDFSFCGKHCQRFLDENDIYSLVEGDCKVLKGDYCDTYKPSKSYLKIG